MPVWVEVPLCPWSARAAQQTGETLKLQNQEMQEVRKRLLPLRLPLPLQTRTARTSPLRPGQVSISPPLQRVGATHPQAAQTPGLSKYLLSLNMNTSFLFYFLNFFFLLLYSHTSPPSLPIASLLALSLPHNYRTPSPSLAARTPLSFPHACTSLLSDRIYRLSTSPLSVHNNSDTLCPLLAPPPLFWAASPYF